MAQITEKELSALGDLMNMESVLAAKCCYMASATSDKALQDRYTQMAAQHQRHLDELFAHVK